MKILVNGSNGHMGKVLKGVVESGFQGAELAGFVDVLDHSLESFTGEADCIIDFSHHAATKVLADYAISRKLPLVVATTGQTEEELEILRAAGKVIPVFRSSNMAIAVAVVSELAKSAVKAFPEADVEIIEYHHNRKVDVPSGTAEIIGNAILEVRPDYHLKTGRNENGKRDPKEITIHSLRIGNEVGTHEVIIAAGTQVITIKHEAKDRAMFAEGAVSVAAFLVQQKPGFYGMKDMISSL